MKKLSELTEQEINEKISQQIGIDITSKGLGDTIAKVTKAFGVKPCGGCKKRQEKLNKLFPYANHDSDK